MSEFELMNVEELSETPFKLIGEDWMLITAQKDDKVNTMTAAWGGLGVMWNKNVAFMVVRDSRYTKEFIDGSEYYSLCFFDHKEYEKQLIYLGRISGRDESKIEKSELTVEHYDGVPYFAESSLVFICRKMYRQHMDPENFLLDHIDSDFYSDKDYHNLYIGEVTKVLKAK